MYYSIFCTTFCTGNAKLFCTLREQFNERKKFVVTFFYRSKPNYDLNYEKVCIIILG